MACRWGQGRQVVAHGQTCGQRLARLFQRLLGLRRLRMRRSENALPRMRNGFKRRHGFAAVIKRGAFVQVEHPRVNPPHLERHLMIITEDASRHRHCFAQQPPGFFETLHMMKGRRVVVGSYEGVQTFLAVELQPPGVYVPFYLQGLFVPS